jgi:hypothetical protein
VKNPVILSVLTIACAWTGWRLGAQPSPLPAHREVARPLSEPVLSLQAPAGSLEHLDPIRLLELPFSEYPAALRMAVQQGWADQSAELGKRWAARDPASLFAFMIAPEGLALISKDWRDWSITEACFEAWFKSDSPAAIAAMESLKHYDVSEGKTLYPGWQAIMGKLLTNHPTQAMEILAAHPDFDGGLLITHTQHRELAGLAQSFPSCAARPGFLQSVFTSFHYDASDTKAHAAGLAWLKQLPPALRLEAIPNQTDLGPHVLELIRNSFSAAELDALDAGQGGSRKMVGTLARIRALQDPAAAADWALRSLDGLARHQAMGEILETGMPAKGDEAAAFLATLPPGPLQDRAMAVAQQRMQESIGHQASADWVLTLPASGAQKSTLARLVSHWALNQPVECAAWITRLPDPEDQRRSAAAAIDGAHSFAEKMNLAAALPAAVGLAALENEWRSSGFQDSRPIAEAAALQPDGPLRESAMAKASQDSGSFFRGYNQAWLDWASGLPTAADRAAALRGAERSNVIWPKWADGIEAEARVRLK